MLAKARSVAGGAHLFQRPARQLAICSQMGLSPDDYRQTLKG
jgi:hypothetical protein